MKRTHVCLAQQCGFVRSQVRALSVVLLLSLVLAGPMQGQTVKEAMNVSTLLQASSSALRSLLTIQGNAQVDTLDSVMAYSESHWTQYLSGTLQSQPFVLSYQGFLTGAFGGDIDVVFNGDGRWGNSWLFANGRSTWYYDSVADGYLAENFEQLTTLDDLGYAWYVGAGALGVYRDGSWSQGWLREGSGLTVTADATASENVIVSGNTVRVDGQKPKYSPWLFNPVYQPLPAPFTSVVRVSSAKKSVADRQSYDAPIINQGGSGTGTTVHVTPEPSGLIAFGSGVAGLGGVFFRRRRGVFNRDGGEMADGGYGHFPILPILYIRVNFSGLRCHQ